MTRREAIVLLIIALGVTPVFSQQPGARKPTGKLTGYDLKGSYGTLIYEGKAERKLSGKNYEYTIEYLKLTFDPSARTNSVGEITVKEIFLTAAIRPAEVKGPSKVLLREAKPLSVVLKKQSPTATVQKVTLVAPKDVFDAADDISIAVTDGKHIWPIQLTERSAATKSSN